MIISGQTKTEPGYVKGQIRGLEIKNPEISPTTMETLHQLPRQGGCLDRVQLRMLQTQVLAHTHRTTFFRYFCVKELYFY